MDSLIEFYLEKGVSGMTILGMMGEAHKLSADESLALLSHVLRRVAGRVPVVVGVSNPELDALAELAAAAMAAGAGGVMVAPDAGLDGDDQVHDYFDRVCTALGDATPLVYQDYPYVTRTEISVDGFNHLVADYPQLVVLKHEDWPGLNKLSAVRASAAQTGLRRVAVLVGNGGLYLPQEMDRGADGAMTGFAYPEMLVGVVDLYRRDRADDAEDLFDAYLPLVRYEQQPNFGLAVRKEILKRRGAIRCARVRDPGPHMTDIDHRELDRLLSRIQANIQDLGQPA